MSADGHIKIAIDVDGKQVEVASKELDNLESAGVKGGQGVKETEDALKGAGDESEKAGGKVKKFVGALGLVAIGAAAFKVLKSSLDDAITRFDTLNKFPKVLEGLGVSAEDAEKSTTKLSDGIDGLPTKLDEIASTAQRMYTSFNDMDKATDSALALNNALLGSGSSSDQARRGTEQYLKALQTGKFDMDTWNTLSETMDVGLVKIAESFGFAGKSAKNDLYQSLQDGSITMDDFNDKLIEVGTGTGIMAELAKENSLGLATSLTNLGTAVSRNMANIIEAVNNVVKAVTGKEIAEHIDSLKHIINAAFTVITSVIEATIPAFKLLGDAMGILFTVAQKLSPVLIGMASAFAIHAVVNGAKKALDGFSKATILSTTVSKASAASTKLMSAAQKAYTGILTAANVVQGVLTGRITLSTAAMLAKAAATKVLGTAMKVMSGPVGWVTVGIGALAGAVVGIVKWFNRATKEGERLTAETEELGEATNELTDAVGDSADAYKSSQTEIEGTAKANEDLAKKIEDLANKENKSASEKQQLASYTDQLNESVDGLNVAYDEEADALNMSSDQMRARLDLFAEQDSANAAQERLTEILKEQNEVESQLEETNELRQEWNEKLKDGSVRSREHKSAIEELDEQEQELTATLAELSDQQVETEEQWTESMEAITEATENGVANQILLFDDLSESQQKTVEDMKATWEDYKDAATDMFDTLSDKSELSVQEMQENLVENQRVIGEWAENIAELAERGVDEGLLNTLREAGPESAGHVNALVNASDEELKELSEVFAKGTETATDAMVTGLGIENSGVLDAVGHMVTDTETALSDRINNAGFVEIGEEVPIGVSAGISAGMSNVEGVSSELADTISETFRSALDIFSPSRVFKGYGTDITDGLGLGIGDGELNVTNAVQALFVKLKAEAKNSLDMIIKMNDTSVKAIEKSLTQLVNSTGTSMSNMLQRMKSGGTAQAAFMRKHSSDLLVPFKNIRTNFSSVGSNAMAGLNSGLWAGSGAVMASARSIANSVAGTMKSALRIHSPSRLMRDDIGKMIPEGIALGIDDNVGSVLRSIMNMNKIITGTPELALGISGGGAMGIGHSVVNNYLGGGGSTTATNTSNSGSTPLLKEQNTLLKALLNKQQDLYMDGEKVTKKVNEINAIEATTNLF